MQTSLPGFSCPSSNFTSDNSVVSATFIAGAAAGAHQGKFSPDSLPRQVPRCHTLSCRRPPDLFPSYSTQLNEFKNSSPGDVRFPSPKRLSQDLTYPKPSSPRYHTRKDRFDWCLSSVTTDATSGRESRRGSFPRARTRSRKRDYNYCNTRSPSFLSPR